MEQMKISVTQISSKETEPWLLNRHYAKRLCPISFAFGAWVNQVLVGVVTYGTPASAPLRVGICGKNWSDKVLELNRLCCNNERNIASALVGRSLRLLPKPCVVVSYADLQQGHVGYVYQAANFLYTGLSAKRTDWAIAGMEHLHGSTIADKSRGQKNRAEWMRKKFGDKFYLKQRSRKHRYVYFCGSKKQKKEMASALLYPVQDYPKGESKKSVATVSIETQMKLI
jgi:hypothetical protein